LRWLEDAINQGEAYSKLPRVVPYTMLPVAAVLILFRIVQATIRILKGEQENLIVSHEAEKAVEEASLANREA
jgi:C4-dicarboxylate transporter DctQ subunit